MVYAEIEKQIQSVPEEYLNEISEFIDYILFKANKTKKEKSQDSLAVCFGSIEKNWMDLKFRKLCEMNGIDFLADTIIITP